MLQVVGHSTPSFKLNYYYSFYFNTVRRGLLKSVGGCMHSHSIDLCHRSHYDTLIKVQYMKYKYMPSTHAWYSRTTHAYIMVCQINFIIVVGLDSLRGFFEYIQHIFKINTIFLWFVCVCVGGGGGGGGGDLSQVRKKCQIFGFQWRLHVWSRACEHVFSVCHKLKLSVFY